MVCSLCTIVTDAAKRMSDTINSTIAFKKWDELAHGWMAFRLADGSSDGVVYDCRADAVRHQLHETLCAYWCFRQGMGGANPRDCQIFLDVHRHAYDNGARMADSDIQRQPSLILSTRSHDILTGRISPHAS